MQEELHEVADVQARRGRVEAAVVRDRPVGECLAQRGLVGGLRDQPRHCSSSRMSLTVLRSLRVVVRPRRSGHSLPYARARRGRRGFAGRYAETVGSPSAQNRHG